MKFYEFVPENAKECTVKAWIHSTNGSPEMIQHMHPAIIICPGGGYRMVSDREAEPVAEPYFAAGFNVFILTYSVGEKAGNFAPLIQLALTIAHIRKYSEHLCTEKQQIAVCGFSAGGHLAASLGTLFNEANFLSIFPPKCEIRPDAMVLCYPVITADEFAHVGSIEKVSLDKTGGERYCWFGLDKHVDQQTPPTFLWHTAEDKSVPVENSLKFAMALSNSKVPFELHVFPEGGHGMSVCTREVGCENSYNARWVEMSIMWLKKTLK